MNSNYRITYLITSWDYGGAEFQVMHLAEKMQNKGHEVSVITMIDANVEFKKLSDDFGIRVESLGMKKGKADIRVIFTLKAIIKRIKPNVLHAHMIHAVILARICKLFMGKFPYLVSTAHNIDEGGGVRDSLYRYTDFLSSFNTNVSKAGTDLYIQKGLFSKNKTAFMPNGIEIPLQKNKLFSNHINEEQNEVFTFLSVGRLNVQKDYPNLIDAVSKLIQSGVSGFQVLVAGDGEERVNILQEIEQNNLNGHIKLLGVRNDVPDLLNTSDSFLMSSAWEGLPIAILEAASHGLPAVVTNVGGCSEVIEDNQNGFVVPPKDSQELANAMSKMINLSIDERKKMGEYSVKKINEEYTMDSVIDRWLKIYQ